MSDAVKSLRIGMIAGEGSGDILGSGLIRELKKEYPEAIFEGIGGPRMKELGFHTFFPMERLSVMGLVEVLSRLPELFRIRHQVVQHFIENPPDIFIGIDSPDFTIGVEYRLKLQGIKTAHYVSPSVWAWRQKRVFKIAKSVDLMLTLLPFEAKFYEQHNVPVEFVGHPLAEQIPVEPKKKHYRDQLNLPEGKQIVAVLPGSRGGEVKLLGPVFFEAMQWLHKHRPDLEFIIPAANPHRRKQIDNIISEFGGLSSVPFRVVDGQSREVMMASDVIIIASGTATLEAMLAKKPMVVAYKLAPITYWIMKRLLKTKYVSLPNLLANEGLVPELIQHEANPRAIGKAILDQLSPEKSCYLAEKFTEMHQWLKQEADIKAAKAIINLLKKDN